MLLPNLSQLLAPASLVTEGEESACNAGDTGSVPCWDDPAEKGMATHSSVRAWGTPWTEEPGGQQSMGS